MLRKLFVYMKRILISEDPLLTEEKQLFSNDDQKIAPKI